MAPAAGSSTPDPLERWDGLSSWLDAIPAGQRRFDLALGVESNAEPEAQARIGYGITSWLSAGAEAYAQETPRGIDVGALAGLSGRF